MADDKNIPIDANTQWHRTVMVQQVAEALQNNNFAAIAAGSVNDAVQKILGLFGANEAVAFGGSRTLQQLGLIEALKERGQNLLLQKPGTSMEEAADFRRKSLTADVYIASPNAVTLDGTLMFVDKIGNRAAGMMFGPKKVIAVAGVNKIVVDERAGCERVETLAAPVNAKRLGLGTPCRETGVCCDCSHPQRICNIAVSLWKKPAYTEYYVVLIPEELGY
jgi:L-lactate utilization protein LutB